MLQIFDRYFFFDFLKYFIGALILLTGVALISKFMENLPMVTGYEGPTIDLFMFFLYNVPNFISVIIAPALLFSVSFTVAMFSGSNELAVVMAAGRSFQRTLTPVVIFTLFLSLFLVWFNETVTFPWNHKAYNLKHKLDGNKGTRLSAKQDYKENYQMRAGNRYYYFGLFNQDSGRSANFHMMRLGEKGAVHQIIRSEKAWVNPKGWELENGSVTTFAKDGTIEGRSFFKELSPDLPERPEYFKTLLKSFEETNISDLKKYMAIVKARGQSTTQYEVEYYWHFSFPLVCFFVIIIGGVVGSQLTKGAMASSVALSTVCSLVYFIIMFFGKSLGNNGTLPPMIAGWLANIVFFFLSVYMLIKFHK